MSYYAVPALSTSNDTLVFLSGRFTCLHFLAFVPNQADDDSNLIKMITNRMKDDLESNPRDLRFYARCRHGRTALHQAIQARNASAAAQLVLCLLQFNDYESMINVIFISDSFLIPK